MQKEPQALVSVRQRLLERGTNSQEEQVAVCELGRKCQNRYTRRRSEKTIKAIKNIKVCRDAEIIYRGRVLPVLFRIMKLNLPR